MKKNNFELKKWEKKEKKFSAKKIQERELYVRIKKEAPTLFFLLSNIYYIYYRAAPAYKTADFFREISFFPLRKSLKFLFLEKKTLEKYFPSFLKIYKILGGRKIFWVSSKNQGPGFGQVWTKVQLKNMFSFKK